MKDWDYSVLTKTANLHGGPKKYIKVLQRQACQEAIHATNKKWLKRTLVLSPFAMIGIVVTACQSVTKIRTHFSKNITADTKPNEKTG